MINSNTAYLSLAKCITIKSYYMATELSPTAKKLMQAMTQTAPAPIERSAETNFTQPYMDAINQQAANDALAAQNAVTPVDNSQTVKQITTESGKQPASTQAKPMSYAEMFVAMNPYKPMTPEERAEQIKRNKRNALFAAISDGVSALSNLYYTTKGAPNSFNGGNTLSGKLYERQRQLMKDQEAREKEYLNGYIRALEMDRRQASDERNWRLKVDELKYKRKRDAADDARKEAKEERDKALHDLNMKLTQGKIDEQQYKAAVQEANAKYADATAKEKLNSQKALTNQRNASAAAAYARANGGGGSGSGVKFKTENLPGGEYAEIPSNLIYDQSFWVGVAEEAGLDAYTGIGRNRKPKSVVDLKTLVKNSKEGRKSLKDSVIKNGGNWHGVDYAPDDRYSDYEISAPSVDEDDELDFDSMIMN